jgi:beta-RFAP synthase
MSSPAVRVIAHARLHFGQIDLCGGLGRRFGAIGVAVRAPRLVIAASASDRLEVEGLSADRVRWAADVFFRSVGRRPAGRLEVLEAIPSHVGLGSGTQLTMGVGLALARLHQIELSTEALARMMRRGERSGVGIGTFAHGGFVVDGGVRLDAGREAAIPPVVFHRAFPPDWWFVIAIPRQMRGLSGSEEDGAFAAAPPMSPHDVGKICWHLVIQMLPAVVERDVGQFGAALTAIQRIVGDYFAGIQGGRFSTPLGSELVARMLAAGAHGAGQSSWGPTVYGLVEGEPRARELAGLLQAALPAGVPVDLICTPPVNTGARCDLVEVEPA